MIEQQIYEDLCEAFLSPAVQTIVSRDYNSFVSIMLAAKKGFCAPEFTSLRNKEVIELYAFTDFLSIFDPNDVVWMYQDKYEDYLRTTLSNEDEEENMEGIRNEYKTKYDKLSQETRKLEKQLKEERIKHTIISILSANDQPMTYEGIMAICATLCPDLMINEIKVRQFLNDPDLFVSIGRKSLYMLTVQQKANVFNGSLYDAISKVLEDNKAPIVIDDLITKVLRLRPDSTSSSVRSIISSMTQSNKLKQFNNKYIGLFDKNYDESFKETKYRFRLSFDERFNALKEFVAANGRMPFSSSSQVESTLLAWYNNTIHKVGLEIQNLVKLYDFQQEMSKANIPKTKEQYLFQQHCMVYKAIVMRTGELIRPTDNLRLYNWFYRSCTLYSSYKDVRKVYFDDLIDFLAAFGFEIRLL